MDHNEALQQMAAERYLLNELTPDAREAFEEHLFDCPECALDLRAGVAFVEEAKIQLPKLAPSTPQPLPGRVRPSKVLREGWFGWLQPSFVVPVFATMLLFIGYQNLLVLPGLREAATQPQLLSWAPLHGSTRGTPLDLTADRKHGVALPIELPQQPTPGAYTGYSFSLTDPQGKAVWTGSMTAPSDDASQEQRLTLAIPGAMLHSGIYSVSIAGVTPQGEHTVIDQYTFNFKRTD
ncbi:MAG: zf-HC2 domain-containing protein [Terracidiphilus sp.]